MLPRLQNYFLLYFSRIIFGLLSPILFLGFPLLAYAVIPSPGGTVDLATDAQIRIAGATPNSGSNVAYVGDVNGDGVGDMAVSNGSNRVYILFGPISPKEMDLFNYVSSNDMGTTGFRVTVNASEAIPSVAGAGDVNGDGLADIVIGSPTAAFGVSNTPGAVFIIYGKTDGNTVTTTTDSSAPVMDQKGYGIIGANSGDFFGVSVAGLGDVNGDGIPDIAVGANSANNGKAYVIFGKHDNNTVFVNNLGTQGYILSNPSASNFGSAIANAHDFNGDGISDIIVGAPNPTADFRDGKAFVFPGGAFSGSVSPLFTINGPDSQGNFIAAFAGASVTGIGDMNGDGFSDVVVRAGGFSPRGRQAAGADFVVLGRATSGAITLGTSGSAAMEIDGANANASSGGGAALASGDFNGDSIPDLVIGSELANIQNRTRGGAVYVIYGSQNPTDVDLANVGNRGYTIYGAKANDFFGYVVDAGDINNDGKPDIIATAPGASPMCRDQAGEVYVILSTNDPSLGAEAGCPTATPTDTPTPTLTPTPTNTPTPTPIPVPTSIQSCQNGGWRNFTNPSFNNQGECIHYVNTR